MTRSRIQLSEVIKKWAQEHDYNYVLIDPEQGDIGVSNTGGYLSWLIKETDTNLNLTDLLDRLEAFVENKQAHKGPDGMFCRQCQQFYEYAEANQGDGTLLCWSCKSNPYR